MSRLVASGAALIAVSYGLARFGLGAFVPELRDAFDLSGGGIGLVMAAAFGGYVVALAVAGPLLSSLTARTMVLASGVTATLGLTGVAVATHPALLAVAAGLGGLSTGWSSTGLATAVEDQLALPHRAGAQTVINAGTSLGLMLAAPVAVAVGVAWRQAFLVFAVLAAAVTIAAGRAVAHREVAPPETTARGWRHLGLTPRLIATAVLLGVTTALFWSFGRELVTTTTGVTGDVARLSWFVLGAGGLLGGLAGRAVHRIGLSAAVAMGWAGLVSAYLIFGVGGAPTAVALFAVALFGAGYMALTGLVIVWAVRVRPEQPGAAVAAGFLLLAVGQTVASPVVGLAVDLTGLAPVSLATSVLALAGFAIVLPYRMRPGRPRSREGATDLTVVADPVSLRGVGTVEVTATRSVPWPTASPTRPRRTSSSTPTTRSTGSHGGRRPSRRRAAATCRSSSLSATRRATGVT